MSRGWYDRSGTRISDIQAAELRLGDPNYYRVAFTRFTNGLEISTVWLGLDHGYYGSGQGPPIIFETMIFTTGEWAGEACWRFATEEEALEHHAKLVLDMVDMKKELRLVVAEHEFHRVEMRP